MLEEYEEIDMELLISLRLTMVYFVSRDIERASTAWEMQVMTEFMSGD